MKKRVMVGNSASTSPNKFKNKRNKMDDDSYNETKHQQYEQNDASINKLILKIEKVVESLILSCEGRKPSPCLFHLSSSSTPQTPDLSLFSVDELEENFKPVLEELENIDAELMLSLERISKDDGGACIGKERPTTRVKPIHDDIHSPSISRKGRRGMTHTNNVRYLHIAEKQNRYSLGIFVFPPGARIPLHDHPGMCVMSRVLYGELRAKTYDFIEEYNEASTHRSSNYTPPTPMPPLKTSNTNAASKLNILKKGSSWLSTILSFRDSFSSTSTVESYFVDPHKNLPHGSKLARQNQPNVILASDVKMLFPHVGNLHEFTAGEQGTAILDVLLPPYEYEEDRDCTFYREEPINSYTAVPSGHTNTSISGVDGEEEDYCWLIPIPQPADFQCTGGCYLNYGEENTS